MNLKLKLNQTIIGIFILAGLATAASCSKDDSSTMNNFQLEGTWQLYRTMTGGHTDSVYEKSPDNEIIFSPKFYWRYADANASDSGSYTITNAVESSDSFNAQINYADQNFQALYMHGDTLALTLNGITYNTSFYIKTSDNSKRE